MLRILHVVYSMERGGTEAFIMNLYRNIDRSKVQFDFLILGQKDSPYSEEIFSLGGRIFYGIPFTKKKIPLFLKKCISIMRQTPYAAVHSHINIMNAWIMLSAKLAGVPKRISHSHDTYGKDGNFSMRILHRMEAWMIRQFATVYLACSKEAGDYLYGESFFVRFGHVVKNGIDVNQFVDNEERAQDIMIDSSCPLVVGNISRFEEKKNQLFLLKVFSHILQREPKAVLLLGGVDGGQLALCREKVKELGMDKSVQFIGVRKDMPKIYRTIDLYLFPSLYEGLGIVLLEAQASNCYCVASNACPTDSDMGLGKIDYISLDHDAKYWADRALEGYYLSKKKLTSEEIRKAFDNRGYSVCFLVKQMTDIYS